MTEKERENFFHNLILISDHVTEALEDLLLDHLQKEKISFTEFINKNRHKIFHLCYNQKPCCFCPPRSTGPKYKFRTRILHAEQLEILFDKHSCSCRTNCNLSAKKNIGIGKLDITFLRALLTNCTNVNLNDSDGRPFVDGLVKFRNKYAHSKMFIKNEDYEVDKAEIEKILLKLADKCGKRSEVKQKLKDSQRRPLDNSLCMQLHNVLLGQVQRERDLIEELESGFQRIAEENQDHREEIVQRIGRLEQNIVESLKRGRLNDERLQTDTPVKKRRSEEMIQNGGNSNTELMEVEIDKPSKVLDSQERSPKKCRTANDDVIEVEVIHKSDLKPYGEDPASRIIRLLLFDRIKRCYTKAVAFEKHAFVVDKKILIGKVYNISGYKTVELSQPQTGVEVRLYESSRIELCENSQNLSDLPEKLCIADVKKCYQNGQPVSLEHVVVTAIGPIRQPNERFLLEVMVKDFSGKIKLKIWSQTSDINFPHSQGDILEICNVEVEKFCAKLNPEIYLLYTEYSKIAQLDSEGLEELLEGEDSNELMPVEVNISMIKKTKMNKHLIIPNARIVSFAKDGKEEFVFKVCNIDPKHGQLYQQELDWYCKECKKIRRGKDSVQLDAKIIDASETCIWVKSYGKTSCSILGQKNYDDLLKYDRAEQIQILKEVERAKEMFTFEISVNDQTKIVTKVTSSSAVS